MAINIKPSHKGELHAELGIPQGKPIATGTLKKAAKTAGPKEAKQINFAENARKWSPSKKPKEVKTSRGTFGMK